MKLLGNPAGAHGQTAAFEQVALGYVSGETVTTIAAGDLVSITPTGTVLKATTAINNKLVIGVASANAAPGKGVDVIVGGLATVTNVGGVTLGDLLQRSAVTAGRVVTVVPAAVTDIGTFIGVAVATAAAGPVLINVQKV